MDEGASTTPPPHAARVRHVFQSRAAASGHQPAVSRAGTTPTGQRADQAAECARRHHPRLVPCSSVTVSLAQDGVSAPYRCTAQHFMEQATRRHATRQIHILPTSLWSATTYRLEARDRDLRPHALEILPQEHARANRQGIRRPRSDSIPERFLQRPAAHHAIRDSGERAIA